MMGSKLDKLWRKDFIVIMLASTGISFGTYFFLATLPIYAQKLTGTTIYSGLMIGIYTFAALAIRPIAGILSDKFGRVRLLILGASICAVVCFLYNWATGLILLLFFRVLHGVGFGLHSTCGGAVAGDVIPKSRMAEGIGYFGLYSTLATAVAPGIALSIIGNGEIENFHGLFILAAAVSLTSLIFDCFITYERKNKKPGQPAVPVHEAPAAVRVAESQSTLPRTFWGFEYPVFLPAAVLILIYMALSSVITFLPLFALDRNLGNIGLYFTVNAAGLLLSRLFVGKITDKRGTNFVVIPSFIVIALCLGLIPLAESPVYLFILAFPLGLAQGAAMPAMNALMFNRCSPQRRGTTSAAYASSIDIGYGIGPIGMGFVAAASNYYFVYWGTAVIALIALALYWVRMAKQPE
jgi:MFS family permease